MIQESSFGLFQSKDSAVIYLGKPIDQVTNLVIERVPGAVVIRASGLTAVQGVCFVQLTPTTEDETPINGVLAYRLEGVRQEFNEGLRLNTHAHSRRGTCFDGQMLAGVRGICLEGARNGQTSLHRCLRISIKG